ncbi:hypothetical protein ACMU_07885 [Actibacterium mucosum KCTC 23349]|uniref:GtrA/DPMS transmembrane domain-containing protein n=1 Tax=Actibacterium mucosum KCTC 23349 TaxID=1454373 RepID=A0A037ZMI2_9RHOB|nr:GtrA family protein [Actibacterium mucosum]KAJ56850.1 hypothetical protein ACMU_07885 [Actibacterium mucosum KCTC 23349]
MTAPDATRPGPFGLLHVATQALRFGAVGVVATLVHAAVGYGAVRLLGLPGLGANLVGFGIAWWVSFLGHYTFTFRGRANRMRALLRFVPHSLVMFGIGMAATALVSVQVTTLPQEALPVFGALVVPLLSFLSSKFYVFRV